MLGTLSRVTTLHLSRSICTAVNDEAVAAQRELDEFFGAEFSDSTEQSPQANAASILGGAQSPCTTLNPQVSRGTSNMDQARLSHIDECGRASMVDVGHVRHYAECCTELFPTAVLVVDVGSISFLPKPFITAVGRLTRKASTQRVARASALVHVGEPAFRLIESNQMQKGDVLSTAQLAGIMGAKHTSSLIPLCHNLFISKSEVQLHLLRDDHAVQVLSEVKTVGQTGVEMEALTAASVAALTVYDMCKAVSKDITIKEVKLEFKSGGKSGTYSSAES